MKKIVIFCASLIVLGSSFFIFNRTNAVKELDSSEILLSSNNEESNKKDEVLEHSDANQPAETSIPPQSSNPKAPLSRGGYVPPSKESSNANTVEKEIALLDWWNEGTNVFSIGTQAKVIDVETGKDFMIQRTTGTNHADSEALTYNDTEKIKEIWGGFSWERRPVYLIINNKRYAASMTAMPHAGLDKSPALKTVSNRSGGFGTGDNLDFIKNNGMDGHIDIHFLNSTRHKDNKKDPKHQEAIKKAYNS